MNVLSASFCWPFVILFCCFINISVSIFRQYAAPNAQNDRRLIVISLDAFKPLFLQQRMAPFMERFYKGGVLATRMNNSFPTKTFVNHFSIATGLYPQNHGVTGNEVYDRRSGLFYKYSYELFHYNPNVLPIWTLNEMQGRPTGVMMWPGSDFEYQKRTCTFTKKLDKKMPMERRVDEVMSWLKNGAKFIMWYFDQPDEDGHAFSPDSQKEADTVRRVDGVLAYLEQSLISQRFYDRTDIIILSDHGMLTVTPRNFINLYAFVDKNLCTAYGSSPVLQMVCVNGKEAEAYKNLSDASVRAGTFNVYTNDQLLERWHVRNSDRFGPIAVVANPPYAFQDMYDLADYFFKENGVKFTPDTPYGVHGYDDHVPSMKPIFMAKGPSFRRGVIVDDQFVNIDLYYLFCRVMKISCIRRDGMDRLYVWQKMLSGF